jgi:hypothetical protein
MTIETELYRGEDFLVPEERFLYFNETENETFIGSELAQS